MWSPEEALPQCEVSDLGYVSCKVPPWSEKILIGRITDWPKETKKEWRNIQCTCYMHAACRTKACYAWEVSQDTLVRWLLCGTPVADASSKLKRELGDKHKEMFKDFDPRARGATPSGEGGAASSAGP